MTLALRRPAGRMGRPQWMARAAMPYRSRLALAAIVFPLLAGCAELQNSYVHATGDYPGLPKREPVGSRPDRLVIDLPEPPVPPPPPLALPFPPATLNLSEAAAVLADDPMALRFLALRALTEQGLVPLSEAEARWDANTGALLPMTAKTRPAVGIDLPIPPVDAILARFRALEPDSAERGFLLEQLLSAHPEQREALAPHDKVAARKLLERLGRLESAGLIASDARTREAEAVETLLATLPEVLLPPEPEEPDPPARKLARSGSGAGSGSGSATRRMPGGVSGKLEVVPSPAAFEPPKISADFTGKAGIHLLSMASAAYGDRAWQALSNQFKQELAGLSFAVQKADLGELGVTYRLIAGPMEAGAAERLCGVIRQKGQACMPTPFPQ